MGLTKQNIARFILMPIYIYNWVAVRNSIRLKNYKTACSKLNWLEFFDKGRRIDFHLTQIEVQINLKNLRSALFHCNCAINMLSKSSKLNRHDIEYLLYFISSTLQEIHELSVYQESVEEIDQERFKIDVKLDSLFQQYNPSSINEEQVSGYLKRHYSLL